jgi:hypothetical protein
MPGKSKNMVAPQTAPSPGRASSAARADHPVSFVSEADVRQALLEKKPIVIDRRTIITPSARDLGQEHDIFQRI